MIPPFFWPLLLWPLGLALSLWPVVSSIPSITSITLIGKYLPADPGDTRFCMYALEHGYRWLARMPGHLSFWDPPFFFPAKNIMAYSETLITSAPLYWLWRVLLHAPDPAYGFWLLSVMSLNYWFFYLWVRRDFDLKPWAAALGAFLFAFGSPRVSQLGHPQLMPQFFSVLAIHALIRIFSTPSTHLNFRRGFGWIGVFFLSCVAQLWTSFYLGWFLAMTLFGLTCWAFCKALWRSRIIETIKSYRKAFIFWGAISILTLIPYAQHYGAVSRQVGMGDFGRVGPWIPKLSSWLYMGRGSWLYNWMHELEPWGLILKNGIAHEHAIGVGFLSLILSLAGLYLEKGRTSIRILGVAAAGLFVASTRFFPHVALWGILYEVLPAAGAIRAVARVGLITLIPLSLGLALWFNRRKTVWVPVLLGAFCILEQAHSIAYYDNSQSIAEIAEFSKLIDPARCRYFFLSPRFMPDALDIPGTASRFWRNQPGARRISWRYQLDAMWVGLATGVPTLNGYSGNFPPGWGDSMFQNGILTPADITRLDGDLTHWLQHEGLSREGLCWISPEMREQ
ncbi:hypothetical protein WDW37_03440 [Bdellovibrionota bacterium FG-1]